MPQSRLPHGASQFIAISSRGDCRHSDRRRQQLVGSRRAPGIAASHRVGIAQQGCAARLLVSRRYLDSRKQTISFKSFKGFEPIAARQARFPQRSVRVVGIVEPLASAAGLRCGTRARLLGKPRGMLSAGSRVVTEMPDGAPYADLMLVPAGGMVLRRMRPAGPSTLPA
jgi:hypothetical protein